MHAPDYEEWIFAFLSCERPYLVKNRMVFRAIDHVEKDQPTTQIKTVPFARKGGALYDATDGCPKCMQ